MRLSIGAARCTGMEARRSLTLVDAVYAACDSGRRVELKANESQVDG
jgi:hypothetical protein